MAVFLVSNSGVYNALIGLVNIYYKTLLGIDIDVKDGALKIDIERS